MRRRARVDDNQRDIVTVMRQLGASVAPTHTVGNGFPDIVVGYNGVTKLVEIKDGSKKPSARRLTPEEEAFHNAWRGGRPEVIESIDDALAMLRAME